VSSTVGGTRRKLLMEGTRTMDQSWIETVGWMSLPVFFAGVGACLIGLIFRVFVDKRRRVEARERSSASAGRLTRLFFEYVGNASFEELQLESRAEDRRRNWQVRKLLDLVQSEIAKREIPRSETEQILEQLRESMRGEGQGPPG